MLSRQALRSPPLALPLGPLARSLATVAESSLAALRADTEVTRDPQTDTVGTNSFEYSRHLTLSYMASNWARPTADHTLPTDSLGAWVPFFFVRTFTPERSYFGEGWTTPVWPPAPREAPWGLNEELWLDAKRLIADNKAISFKSAAQLRQELDKGPEKLPSIPSSIEALAKSSYKAPTMEALVAAADRLLDAQGKAEVAALKAQFEDASRRNFPLRSAPTEPDWDALTKAAPPSFASYYTWAKSEWARIAKEAGAAAYPSTELNAALKSLSEAQVALFDVQADALKSLETFLPWQEGTERITEKFFKEGNLYMEEYLAVNPVFRERIDHEILEGNTYGALDCLPISEGHEQQYATVGSEQETCYDALNNTPGNVISPHGKDWAFDFGRALPGMYGGPYSHIPVAHH